MKYLLLFAAMALVGCGNEGSATAEGSTLRVEVKATHDPALVEAFKRDKERLRTVLAACAATESVECSSARKANYVLMFAPPAPAASAPRVFVGGSRDLKSP